MNALIAAFCNIDNVADDGTLQTISLTPGQEQYCASGEFLKFRYGSVVDTIKCSGASKKEKMAKIVYFQLPDSRSRALTVPLGKTRLADRNFNVDVGCDL